MTSDPLTSRTAGIVLVGAHDDEYGRILRANQRFADLLVRQLDALVGTRICEHVHPGSQGEARDTFFRLMADLETVYEGNGRLVTSHGSVVPVRAFASVITLRGGAAIVLRVLALSE
ncbi:MAG: PAS domain-containing protein [Solirubrobacteraceae bacterium]